MLALLLSSVAYAVDLPIDIEAIGRQAGVANPAPARFGAHLFTDDAQRINALMAEQVSRRQEIATYLFAYAPLGYTIEPHAQFMSAVADAALFDAPISISRANVYSEEDALPIWLIISVFAVCAVGGFIWALVSSTKRKERGRNVH